MNAPKIYRLSPIKLPGQPAQVEQRGGWPVILEYAAGSDYPALVDLSHHGRWDLQNSRLDELRPAGLDVPARPGEVTLAQGLALSRLNRVQAVLWHLWGPEPSFDLPGLTEITDGQALLALIGPGVGELLEKVTDLDLARPPVKRPCLLQGPILRLACQVLVLEGGAGETGALIAAERGYGSGLAATFLRQGASPAGEEEFQRWIKAVSV
ncbi:MAG: hypothetical protein AB1641_23525 [Thermodesulfobacteriota bacterium]